MNKFIITLSNPHTLNENFNVCRFWWFSYHFFYKLNLKKKRRSGAPSLINSGTKKRRQIFVCRGMPMPAEKSSNKWWKYLLPENANFSLIRHCFFFWNMPLLMFCTTTIMQNIKNIGRYAARKTCSWYRKFKFQNESDALSQILVLLLELWCALHNIDF